MRKSTLIIATSLFLFCSCGNSLTDRFGWNYGRKLAEGNLEVGMTKEMCCAIDIDSADYKISKYIEENGDIIEEWQRDFSKLRSEIDGVWGPGFAPNDESAERIVDLVYANAESFSKANNKALGKKIPNNQLVNTPYYQTLYQ